MKYADFCERLTGVGADAWAIHERAQSDAARGEQVVILSVGDPDLATAEPIVEAAIAALRAGDTHYQDVLGKPALRELIAKAHASKTGRATTADQVMVFSGAQNALFSTMLCLLNPGDEVVVLEPAYVTYPAAIGAANGVMVQVPQRAETGFRPDLDRLSQAITQRTKVILLASPNNPTGVVLNHQELARIAELACAHDCWVVSDEVYNQIVFDTDCASISSMPGMESRSVVLNSLSKSHSMTGFRLGWSISPAPLVEHFGRLALAMLYGLPGFIQAAGIAALRAQQHVPCEVAAIYRTRLEYVLAQLSDVANLRVHRPQGGMFLMLDIRATGLSSQEFSERLYDEMRVSVLAGEAFGPSGAGHVRLSFAVDSDTLREGISRIMAFCRTM